MYRTAKPLDSKNKIQDEADHADDQRTQEGGDETIHGETDLELSADPARQHKEQCIDQQSAEAQGKDDQWAGQHFKDGFDDGIDHAKNKGQPQEREPVAVLNRDAIISEQVNGHVQRNTVGNQM